MNTLPKSPTTKEAAKSIPVLPLHTDPASYSTANRRTSGCSIQKVYPWLLFASTAVAATFCLAYITKPVIVATSSPSAQSEKTRDFGANGKSESANSLTDENNPTRDSGITSMDSQPTSLMASDFEETNIRIQHVIDAESPSGDVSRLTIDVPVLYRSRTLRWSQSETAQARDLLERLAAYQDQVRNLRDEGTQLLSEWNTLVGNSIPGPALRADSPSLPANQQDPFAPRDTKVSDSVETIKIQTPEK